MTSIYVLIDPRDGEIRYVGMTGKTLETRLRGRLKDTRCRGHRRHWLDQLKRMGMTPTIQLIQEVPTDFGGQAEVYWISYFRAVGCNLVNGTDGGEGGHLGVKMSEETKEKLRQATIRQFQDPEARRQVSLVHKGKTISPLHKRVVSAATTKRWEKWRADGSYTSPETRAKISASRSHEPLSDEYKRKMSLKLKGVPKSAEHRQRISDANRRFHAEKRRLAQCQ